MPATASRQGAIERAIAYCDDGGLERDLGERVAIRTESQKGAAAVSELQRYLTDAMQPAFESPCETPADFERNCGTSSPSSVWS